MQLPAFFGHKKSINLLPRDAFESSTVGVILEWSLVFGKWSVILTQLVVMGAFLYRFALDRNLTDLRKTIAQDVAVIQSYEQIERDFILIQKRVTHAKTTMAEQKIALETLNNIGQITPREIWYDRISMGANTLSMTAYAASLPAFGQFLTAIQSNPKYSGVRIGKIESSSAKGAQMQFDLTITMNTESDKGAKK